ncbi:MAG TPA: ferritin family protein [Abditibacteriaceae bacterium]|jgi:rubrerythrin|nr:ferritin family protein [Abditibacteriaceae bacterium]
MLKNNSYNLVTALSEKSEALSIYDDFIEDAQEADSPECAELWQQIREDEERHVELLKEHVEKLVQSGKF